MVEPWGLWWTIGTPDVELGKETAITIDPFYTIKCLSRCMALKIMTLLYNVRVDTGGEREKERG